MGGKGSGRKPDPYKQRGPKQSPVGNVLGGDFYFPNLTGMAHAMQNNPHAPTTDDLTEGSTHEYSKWDKSGSNLTPKNNEDVTIPSELKGARQIIQYGSAAKITATSYLRTAGNTLCRSDVGNKMMRSGSIVGFSYVFDVTGVTTHGNFDIEIRVNDSTVMSGTITIPAFGIAVYEGYTTQARDTDTFSAGDLIQAHITYNSGQYTIGRSMVLVDLQVDS